jgi:hypothetical protein
MEHAAVVMNSSVFWDITPCSLLIVDVPDEHVAKPSKKRVGKEVTI